MRNREVLRHARDDRKPLRDALRAQFKQEFGEAPNDATIDRLINQVLDFARHGDTYGSVFADE